MVFSPIPPRRNCLHAYNAELVRIYADFKVLTNAFCTQIEKSPKRRAGADCKHVGTFTPWVRGNSRFFDGKRRMANGGKEEKEISNPYLSSLWSQLRTD